jgi:5'-3' exonuclease
MTLITNWGNAHMATYKLSTVLSCLNLTSTQFVDFCLLCGTDFSSKVKGVGPASAIKQILEYGTLERLNFNIPNEAHEDMIKNGRPIFFHNIIEDMYV